MGTQLETTPDLQIFEFSSSSTLEVWAKHLTIRGKENQIPALNWQ